jgi:hypothetical protein
MVGAILVCSFGGRCNFLHRHQRIPGDIRSGNCRLGTKTAVLWTIAGFSIENETKRYFLAATALTKLGGMGKKLEKFLEFHLEDIASILSHLAYPIELIRINRTGLWGSLLLMSTEN